MITRKKYKWLYWPYWRIVLFNILHEEHPGHLNIEALVKQSDEDSTNSYPLPSEFISGIIDNIPRDNRKAKILHFVRMTHLNKDKFFSRDLKVLERKFELRTVMTIIMGLNLGEMTAKNLLSITGYSLDSSLPLHQAFRFIKNLRGRSDFKRFVKEEYRGDIIYACNHILEHFYKKYCKDKYEDRQKEGKGLPRDWVLGQAENKSKN